MQIIISAVLLLGTTGAIASIVLYIISKKFEVYEDPRIAAIREALPTANCGGCGYRGCADFATACIKAGKTDGLNCPVGGKKVMEQISVILTGHVEQSLETPQ
jgi:Na+-translocating ferredoxin:NAD+ oxidoreductase RNF subunit RnfB